ncbi:hypothetical protein PO181_00160 [Leuconostoc suionicum]|uniref:hypothetical protein n=1 Tax=Leuconostoc suionicum TaxID=1511761 RepID=UPI00233EDD3C|nr:hypothetical protein [Leuconostoc suionicum]MDC2815417.1 hypothetical protein [Leuconostoc suionicum]
MEFLANIQTKKLNDSQLAIVKGGLKIPGGLSYYGLALELPDIIKGYNEARKHH